MLIIEVPLEPYASSIIPPLPAYDEQPRYLIFAGLVLQVVEPRYLELYERNDIDTPPTLAIYADRPAGWNGIKELVIISRVLSAPINRGYGVEVTDVRVDEVNGRKVFSFDDVKSALAMNLTSPHVEIVLETGVVLKFAASEVKAADAAIRERYGVR